MPSPGQRASRAYAAYGRAAAALLSFSAWMGLLFAGFLLHGALHLLLVVAALLFPWRSLPPPVPPVEQAEPPQD
jgi:hypothetical protein